jgi:hypothetical protein
LAWSGVRSGAQDGTSDVRCGVQDGTSGVRCGAQVQLPEQVQIPAQVQLPAQLSNSTGWAKAIIPAAPPPRELKRRTSPLAVLRAVKFPEIENIHRLPEVVMHDEHLTADECDELAEALRQDAAVLPNGSEKAKLMKLSECYCDLAYIKRMVLRKVN